MNNKLRLISIVFLCVIVFGVTWIQVVMSSKSNFTCDSEISFKSATGDYDGIMLYHFKNGQGDYNTVGTIKLSDGTVKSFNRSIKFEYIYKNDKLFILQSTNDVNDIHPQAIINPEFFHIRRGLNIKVKRANKNGYIFIYGDTPFLYCKNIAI